MEIGKSEIKDDLQDIPGQADQMEFAETIENDVWRRELLSDYIVKKMTIVSESLVCYITGCVNTRDNDKYLCDEHFID
jgi:hypothetical protein